MKEQLDIEINLEGEDDLEKIIRDIESGLEPTVYLENQILESTSKRLDKLKKTRAIVNDILKARGDTRKAEIVEDEAGSYSLVLKQQAKKINQDKRETRGLEHLLRRYRWAQSLFLVTQNFMGRMGESVSVFGAGMNLLFAPLKMLLNVILLPALPLLAAFSKWVMGLVKGFSDWYLQAGGLATAISTAAWSMAMFIQTLPIAGLLVGIGEGLKSLIYGFLGIEDVAKPAGEAGETFGSKLGKGLKGAFDWMIKEGPTILKGFWDFLKEKVTWIIDNAPTIKTKLTEIWTYLDQTVIPGVKTFLSYLINADIAGILSGIWTKAEPIITAISTFLTKHGGLIEKIIGAGGVVGGAVSKVLGGPIGAGIMAADLLVSPAGGGDLTFSGTNQSITGGTTPQRISSDTFNITINSSATNSDEFYTDFTERLRRDGIARGAI